MAPAPCWPTKAIAPDSGNVLPILIVVSVKPWPFDATFLGMTGAGSPGAGAGPPLDAPASGPCPAAEDGPGALSTFFVPAGADDGLAADAPDFAAGAADAAPFTASSSVVALPSGVVTGCAPGSAGAAVCSGA